MNNRLPGNPQRRSVVQAMQRVLAKQDTIDVDPSELSAMLATDIAITRARDFARGKLKPQPMTLDEADRELWLRVPAPLYYSLDVGRGRIDGSPVRTTRVTIWAMMPAYTTLARSVCGSTRAAVEDAIGAMARWIAERENGKAA